MRRRTPVTALKTFASLLAAIKPAAAFVAGTDPIFAGLRPAILDKTRTATNVLMGERILVEGGPLRRQIADKVNPFTGTYPGYSDVRKDMMKAFAAYSNDKTDMGYIDSADTLRRLMSSCGDEMTQQEAKDMFTRLCSLKKAKPTQSPGTFVYEQFAKIVMEEAQKLADAEKGEKKFFGLF